MAKISSKNKIIIATVLMGLFLFGAIVSVALVLAANQQNVSTNVTVRYVVDGVAAKVSANYAIIPADKTISINRVSMTTSSDENSVEFDVDDGETTKELMPDTDIELNTSQTRVVYEYSFTNTASSAFTISFNLDTIISENMKIRYAVSKRSLDEAELRNNFNLKTLDMQAMTEKDKTMYIYISVEVDDKNDAAAFEASFVWSLVKAESTIDLSLDNNGGTGGASSITAIPNAVMPIVYDLPTLENKAFGGYYVGETQYINENGVGVKSCDLSSSDVLTAKWTDSLVVVDNGTVINLTSVGETAETIVIPDTVEVIADSALSGATATNIIIPNSVTSIGESAFENCTNLESVTYGDTSTAAYADDVSQLYNIGASAFKGCTNLAEVIIPANVKLIGAEAFSGCSNITKVYFYAQNMNDLAKEYNTFYEAGKESGSFEFIVGNNVRNIPAFLFYVYEGDYDETNYPEETHYPYLSKITFEGTSKVEIIGKRAFRACKYLTEVTIPKSVKELGMSVFMRCSNLETVNFEEGSKLTTMQPEVFRACTNLLNIEIPEMVTSIGWMSFYDCENIEELTLPSGLTSMGASMFCNNYMLKSMTIPSGITTLGHRIFLNCTSLESVVLPDNIKTINTNTFEGCTNLVDVTLPANLTTIKDAAFKGCEKLAELEIPIKVTTVGAEAFANCVSLTQIYIPYRVKSIGEKAFYGCDDSLVISCGNEANTANFNATWNYYNDNYTLSTLMYTITSGTLTAYPTELTEIVIPKDVTKINTSLFKDNTSITSIIIPKSVTTIGERAFGGCTNLTEIIIPNSITTFGNYAFSGCSKLKRVIFEENSKISTIGQYAFSMCTSLESVEIPKSVTNLKAYTFNNCYSITTISFEEGSAITTFGAQVFRGCYGLKNLIIPESVTTIGAKAFYDCSSALKVYVTPTSILSGWDSTWSYYTDSASVNVLWGSEITTVDGLKIIEGVLVQYTGSDENVVLPSTITAIEQNAFKGNTTLKSVTIPSSVLTIGASAFYNCKNLTTVNLNNGLTTIGASAFYNCSKLNSVVIPSTLTSMGSSAFRDCESVTSVTIENGLTAISSYAFYNCSSLETITIPSSITSIGNLAFSGCSRLLQIRNLSGKSLSGYTVPNYADVKTDNSEFTSSFENDSQYFIFNNSTDKILLKIVDKTITSVDDLPDGLTMIIDSVFRDCNELTTIVLPSTLKRIGNNTFYNCSNLSAITIPDSVIQIGSYAFYNCTSLESVLFGNSLTSIGSYAFSYSSKLKEVIIPDSVSSVGYGAFENCTGLESITIGVGVINLGNYAFYNTTALTEINFNAESCNSSMSWSNYIFCYSGQNSTGITLNIGSSVSYIARYMFYPHASATFAPYIKNVIFAENSTCTSINGWAFKYCENIENIELPTGLRIIGEQAFYNCKGLTTITIPSSVNSIGNSAFDGCISLIRVRNNSSQSLNGWQQSSWAEIKTDNSEFASIVESSENYVIFVNGENRVLLYVRPRSITSVSDLPTDITAINSYAFYQCTNIKEITIPESVTEIGMYAFYGCTGLTSINIPSAIIKIGNYAFYECTGLTAVYSGSLDSWINIDFGNSSSNPLYYAKALYINGVSATQIELPSTLTEIKAYTFYNAKNMTSITIPEGVTSIGTYAFYGCSGLTALTIPESVLSIGSYAFYDCSLTSLSISNEDMAFGSNVFSTNTTSIYTQYDNAYYIGNSENPYLILVKATSTSIASCEIHENTVTIAKSAFNGCTKLTSINLPSSVKSIGSSAFYNCSKLVSVYVDSIEDYLSINLEGIYSTPLYYATKIYVDATLLTSLVIPSTITKINNYAFYKISSLSSLTIPSSVTSIGISAFYECTGLKTITINSSVLEVQNSAFYNCNSVTEFSIAGILTNVGNSAFYNCGGLTSVTIQSEEPSSIGSYAFYSCDNLKTVVIGSGVTSVGSFAFNECSNLTSLTLGEDLETTEERAFGAIGITSITIPKSVRNLAPFLFSTCPNLASITFEDGSNLTLIGQYAFSACEKLTTMTIPEGVTTINQYAFNNNYGLINVVLPSTLTTMGNYIFRSCTSLNSVNIPDGITSIGENAFYECNSLPYNQYDNAYYLGNSENPYVVLIKAISTNISSCEINENTKYIYCRAFYDTKALTTINFNAINCADLSSGNYIFYCSGQSGNGITVNIGANVTKIPACLFYSNYSTSYVPKITSVIFGENSICTSIGSNAFSYCTSLTSITIPSSVTSIGSSAFYDCTSLTSITIPTSVTSIGSSAFYNCRNLVQVRNLSGLTLSGYTAPSYAEVKTDNSEFSSTLEIGEKYAIFTPKDSTEKILLCATDKTITGANDLPSDLTQIGQHAFSNCTSLTSVTIPSSVTSIGIYAFSNCTSLTSVTIGSGVTSIGSNAFYYCSGLTSITIPSSVTSIGYSAFYYCTSLTSVTIGSGVTSIGNLAFYNCSSLTSVTIPSSVTSIGYCAFYGCSKLTSVTFDNNTEGWWYASSSTAISGTSLSSTDLGTASTAARYLTNTYRYYYWKRG